MANDANDRPEDLQAKPKLLTPGEIANLGDAAAGANALKGTMQNVGEERSGQLSPPHTPGRRR
jgi:hypothetical protein